MWKLVTSTSTTAKGSPVDVEVGAALELPGGRADSSARTVVVPTATTAGGGTCRHGLLGDGIPLGVDDVFLGGRHGHGTKGVEADSQVHSGQRRPRGQAGGEQLRGEVEPGRRAAVERSPRERSPEYTVW